MKVAFGLKAHSGWASLVVIGEQGRQPVIVDRRRIELVETTWAKQPYHAAEGLAKEAARSLVEEGIASAHHIALQEIRAARKRESERTNRVAACAVLVLDPMPDWSIEEILAVHFRMHRAEGALFRDALVRAAKACRLPLVTIHERELSSRAKEVFGDERIEIAALGRSVGPPWGKDQKDSALAALVALKVAPSTHPK